MYREFFAQSPDAAALTTPGDRILQVNQRFTAIFGYTPEQANGRQLADLIVPAGSREDYRKLFDRVAGGKRANFEVIHRRADGREFSLEITKFALNLNGRPKIICSIFQDLTETRQAEEERRSGDGLWRTIFNDSPVGIALANSAGQYIDANRAFQEMIGYSAEDLRGVAILDLTAEDQRDENRTLMDDLWAGRRSKYQLEKRMQRKDGQWIWVRATVCRASMRGGHPPLGVGTVEDITAWKLAVDSLREYEEVVEGLQEMILLVDRDYRYVIANRAFLNNHGLTREEVVGHPVMKLVGQEKFNEVTRHKLEECFAGKTVVCEMQFTFPVTGTRDLLGTYFPIRGPGGVDRAAVVLTDVTERKKAERDVLRSYQELKALNAQLQNVREEERTILAREIHDELGQSLTAIRIDLAALRTAPEDQRTQRIEALMALADETIRSVRRISTELRPGILDHLGLVAAIDWGVEDFQARTGIECDVKLPEAVPDLDPDCATALFRIFQETLTNIARHSRATFVRVTLTDEGAVVMLEVRDNGKGMNHDQLAPADSLGILGMRERTLLLGGEFRITSQPGAGTTVCVRIPRYDWRKQREKTE